MNGTCIKCVSEKAVIWQRDNRDLTAARRERHKNKDLVAFRANEKAVNKTRYAERTDKQIAEAQVQVEARRPSIRATKNAWKARNPDNAVFLSNRRRAQQMNASPAWADQGAIAAIYAERQRLATETGAILHVDHLLPLLNPTICGLHIAANLQIITGLENWRKNNRYNRADREAFQAAYLAELLTL